MSINLDDLDEIISAIRETDWNLGQNVENMLSCYFHDFLDEDADSCIKSDWDDMVHEIAVKVLCQIKVSALKSKMDKAYELHNKCSQEDEKHREDYDDWGEYYQIESEISDLREDVNECREWLKDPEHNYNL